jgi:hypothetical protein
MRSSKTSGTISAFRSFTQFEQTETALRGFGLSSFTNNGKVWVLGAGASTFAGYPLASGLLPFIRDLRSVDSRTNEIASKMFDKLNVAEMLFEKKMLEDPSVGSNLEELLTYLDLYRTFPRTAFAINPWDRTDSDAVRRVISEKFLGFQYDMSKYVWGTNPIPISPVDARRIREIARAWGQVLKSGDTILSFNWDILHEVILWQAGVWSYRDGYGFHCAPQGEMDRSSEVLLLKLHGSVNWVQGDEAGPVTEIASVADFFAKSKDWQPRTHFHQAQIDWGRKLVLPTYLKDITANKALLDVWTKAHEILSQAKELIVVGYSLNKVDHPARLLFGTALSENQELNKVTVVSPGTTEWDNFLCRINKQLVRIEKPFEDWVCANAVG